MNLHTVLVGDALEILKGIDKPFAHCVVTSIPYFNLRSYLPKDHPDKDKELGNESSPAEFIARVVGIFREVRRVLRDDGTLWLNVGDTYACTPKGNKKPGGGRLTNSNIEGKGVEQIRFESGKIPRNADRTDGNLLLIPHRLAIAMQDDGWILRGDDVWRKLTPMPGPLPGWRWTRCRVKTAPSKKGGGRGKGAVMEEDHRHMSGMNEDWQATWEDCPGCKKCERTGGFVLKKAKWRTTRCHEYLFQFTKSSSYYGDPTRVLTPLKDRSVAQEGRGDFLFGAAAKPQGGANPRSVLTFRNTPTKVKHFATFPISLPLWCLRVSVSEAGCCAYCGAPFVRKVKVTPIYRERPNRLTKRTLEEGTGNACPNTIAGSATETLGWNQSCQCPAADPVPCTIFDPFVGSGTTLVAATALGMFSVGFDINEANVPIIEQRIAEGVNVDLVEGRVTKKKTTPKTKKKQATQLSLLDLLETPDKNEEKP